MRGKRLWFGQLKLLPGSLRVYDIRYEVCNYMKSVCSAKSNRYVHENIINKNNIFMYFSLVELSIFFFYII